jgi:hypothetical protein
MMILNRIAPTRARNVSLAALAGTGFFLSATVLLLHVPPGARSPAQMSDTVVTRLISECVVREGGETNAPGPAAVPGTSDAWWEEVQADLGRREYEASTTPQGLQAPNRAHNLRMTFGERGIEVVPRTGKDVAPAWRFAWETIGIGRTGQMQAVEPVSPESEGSRVTYRRDGWSEWYENTAKGLEQGFTIERKPAGESPLRIMGEFPEALRPEPREDGAIDFIDDHGACAIRYGELHVWDARGEEIPSRLELDGLDVAIVIDDDGATYPLTVDPLMTSPAWTAESNQAGCLFGFSVAPAGDVNGDGFSDVIVGAWGYTNGQSAEGRAFVYHGSAAGLSFTPNWTAESNQVQALFGYSVATAGDVNGDGFSDVIVGAIYFANGEANEGRAFVYHGSASGLSPTPNWIAESDQASAQFGQSVAPAGDVNGDGFSDVIVGAIFFDNGEAEEGRAFVYHGSASGLSLAANWTAESNQVDANFGISIATAGDVNGDGYSDVIVGAPDYDNGQGGEGWAFVYHGSASGLSPTPNWTAESNQASAQFGVSVAGAGDVNGDGYGDVIVGAQGFDNGQSQEGRAYVYRGSVAGLATSPAWTAESDQAGSSFGHSVATAGDVNGDGFADVIVGAHNFANGQSTEGRAYVYQGSTLGLATSPAWTAESNQIGAKFGQSVATAGDVNGDGYSDVIVGAPEYENGQTDEGRAFVYHGSAGSLATSPVWTAESNQSSADFGISVATAGDVNGDGFSDVIVGALRYDNGETEEGRAFVYHGSAAGLSIIPAWTSESDQAYAGFGYSVATTGDVNGDGFSDVIVGALYFDGGQTNEGRAYVYHGSPGGLATLPVWIAESNQEGAFLGWSVGTAGDVNGDGFSDVIVGAPGYDNGETDEGRALVYHGSAGGLSTSPVWTAELNQALADLGVSVGTAGDVNGDGFSDVIAGAPFYGGGEENKGRAFVYHGSIEGLADGPAWTTESDQADNEFAASLATAGDVNGDGFSDVIVGARYYDNGETDEGRAFVYHGSPSGLGLANWTSEGDRVSAIFGHSVSTAGDVNGDGFSDVIVGAVAYTNGQPAEGRAFVYHGSAIGVRSALSWTAESDQDFASFGWSVAAAGDVNGDGYGDVIVGATEFSNGQAVEGQAFVYYGNEGDGLDRVTQQWRMDNSRIEVLGLTDDPQQFRLRILGRTPGGRGRVRLEGEVQPFGTPFEGGADIFHEQFEDTGAPGPDGSVVQLATRPGNLDPGTLYCWRVRTASDSPFFPRSPWFTLAGNALAEADLRTAETVTAVEEISAPAAGLLLLEPVHPNPLRALGEIAYTLPGAGRVRLAAYDVTGRQVAVLSDGAQEGGRHALRWDGRDAGGHALPAGVYLLRLETSGLVTSRKLVIAR